MPDFDDEFPATSEGFTSLRKAYEKLSKANTELTGKVSEFETRESKSKLADVFKAKGIVPEAAELYSGSDFSETSVASWIERHGALLPKLAPVTDELKEGETPEPGAEPVSEEQKLAQRLQSLNTGTSLNGGTTLEQQIQNAKSPEELTSLLRQGGMGAGPGI